jgi:hypothetical protein
MVRRMEPMSGRWVCRRCYESNDADATACARCGLERGAEPTDGDAAEGTSPPAQWAPVAKQDSRPPWLKLLLRFGWVGVVIVIAVVGILLNARRDDSGQISSGGNLQIQDLRVGDCFNIKDETADSVSDVEAHPCTQAHKYEMYHVADMAAGDYPTDQQMENFAGQECLPAFASYVGTTYDESALNFFYFAPGQDAWDDGDRSVQCAAFDPENAELTSSLKNAAR